MQNTHSKINIQSLEQRLVAIPHACTVEDEHNGETRNEAEVGRKGLNSRKVAGKLIRHGPAVKSPVVIRIEFVLVDP